MPRPTERLGKEEGWQEARARQQSVQAQEVLPLHRRRREGDRLQGHRGPQGLHPGKRQDHAGADHRHEGALPAPAVDRDQARALPRARSVHRPALSGDRDANHSARKDRQRRQPGRRRQGQARLRAQLPDPAGEGEARHAREHQADRGEARRAREGRRRTSWPRRRNRRRRSRACRSRSRRRPAWTGGCSGRSPTSTSSKR